MKKDIAKRAAREIVRDSTVPGWIAVIITAVGAVLAWQPGGHHHHWVLMLAILIIGIPVAGLLDSRRKKG